MGRISRNFLYIAMVVVGIFIVIVGSVVWRFDLKKTSDVVFYVNGVPVYQEELKFQVEDLRLSVRNELINNYQIVPEEFSWNYKYDNERTALEYLMEKAIQNCAYFKLIQQEGKVRSLVEKIDYPSIKSQKEEENRDRTEKKETNQVFYGVLQFTEKEFYDYFNRNLKIQVINAMEKEGTFQFTKEELQELYNQEKEYFDNESFEVVENSVKTLKLQQEFEVYIQQMLADADIDIKNREVIYEIVEKTIL